MRKLILLIFLFIITVLLSITLYNTFSSFSKQQKTPKLPSLSFNDSLSLERAKAALRIPFVNNPVDSIYKMSEIQFFNFLEEAYPNIHNNPAIKKLDFGKNSRLYRWTGIDDKKKPILLISSFSVKDPDLNKIPQWTFNPFLGKTSDGFFWGAGTMENKMMSLAILEAVEFLISLDNIPQRSLSFAFIEYSQNTNDYRILSEFLQNESYDFEFILNTGSFVTEGFSSDLNKPVAELSCTERKELILEIREYNSDEIKNNLEKLLLNNFRFSNNSPSAKALLKTYTAELPFFKRWLFSNQFIFWPLTNSIIKKDKILGRMLYADMEIKELSAEKAIIKWLLPPDTDIKKFKEEIVSKFKKGNLKWILTDENRTNTEASGYAFEALQTTIRESMGDIIVIPAIKSEPSFTNFSKLSKAIFDFSPRTLDSAEYERFKSGIDQRIKIKEYKNAINFYARLIKNTIF